MDVDFPFLLLILVLLPVTVGKDKLFSKATQQYRDSRQRSSRLHRQVRFIVITTQPRYYQRGFGD